MNAADIEDTDWARAPVDVTTNYKIEKKVGCLGSLSNSIS